jgi:uncharacterized membrane protein
MFPPMSVTSALTETRDRFPVWFGVWFAICHVLTGTLLLEPARTSTLATMLLPLAWAVAYYAALPAGQRPSTATLATLIVAAPFAALVCWLPAALLYRGDDLATLRFAFELLAPLWAFALIAHCKRQRGWAGVAVFFGLGAAYGLALETSGIDLGYFTEADYRIYVPFTHTPLSSVAGWCTVFYPAVYAAETIAARMAPRSRMLVPAAIVTASALSSDLHFDPVATALGMWVWNAQLEPVWFGVPLVNFTSWFAAVSAAALVYFWASQRFWPARMRLPLAIAGVIAALTLSAAINLVVIGVLEGFDGPSWQIFRAYLSRSLASLGMTAHGAGMSGGV